MKHKIFAQLLLVLCLVVSCSEVPPSQYLAHQGTGENSAELSGNGGKKPDVPETTRFIGQIPPQQIISNTSPAQKAAFLQAEQLLLQHDTAGFLTQMQQLKDYPLYPYLQSQWLRKNLQQTAEIELFLAMYKDSYYANLLRQDWLTWLAKNQQWAKFVLYYQEANDEKKTALQCHFALAKYNAGEQETGLNLAKTLWLKGVSQSACDETFAIFAQSASTEELLWQRFSALLRAKKANTGSAMQLKQYMSPDAQKTADLWLKVHNHPAIIAHPQQWDSQNPKAGDIFAHGIARLAHHDLSAAIGIWSMQKSGFSISPDSFDYVQQTLGLALAAEGDYFNAYSFLIQANNLDENARHSLVRSALRKQNWPHISAALTKLTEQEKSEDKWRYWQARAFAETGKKEQAREIFADLAKKSNFYAFLAADKLKTPYQVTHIPVPVTVQDLTALQQQEDFKIVSEWLILERKDEALKQWWYTIKKSAPQQIMVAAKLAQAWQMNKLAAFTIAKADYWNDLELRFPMAFTEEINHYALQFNLDPALVFGLIRQESVFDELAGSSVGARGLMQIMPSTGRQIARQLQESWRSDASLYEPDTNIKYGTFYYKQLLDKFNGQAALAAAGYNAGPGRVKQWLPDKPMAMDIWIETIPFNETRQYVSLVLSNALFYQHRMKRDMLKIADFMQDVHPL